MQVVLLSILMLGLHEGYPISLIIKSTIVTNSWSNFISNLQLLKKNSSISYDSSINFINNFIRYCAYR